MGATDLSPVLLRGESPGGLGWVGEALSGALSWFVTLSSLDHGGEGGKQTPLYFQVNIALRSPFSQPPCRIWSLSTCHSDPLFLAGTSVGSLGANKLKIGHAWRDREEHAVILQHANTHPFSTFQGCRPLSLGRRRSLAHSRSLWRRAHTRTRTSAHPAGDNHMLLSSSIALWPVFPALPCYRCLGGPWIRFFPSFVVGSLRRPRVTDCLLL